MPAQSVEIVAFKYKEIAPQGSKFVHANMRRAFCAFLFNDQYMVDCEKVHFGLFMMNLPIQTTGKKGFGDMVFHHPDRPKLIINVSGEMCAMAQKRYAVFLKMYLRHGKKFIENLNDQIKLVRNAAA